MGLHVTLKFVLVRERLATGIHGACLWLEPWVEALVPCEIARSGERLGARLDGTGEGLLTSVGLHVLFQRELAFEPVEASRLRAYKWSLL